MSQMKKLAVWLAQCVYQYHLSDAEILQACGLAVGDIGQTRYVQWLLTQIETVRQYPEIYRLFL
ncbi:MAG: hypothetical protein HN413_18470 [Chloroflexi bacterium]|nr:hypothetical protein [Chloroflexota bacterium]